MLRPCLLAAVLQKGRDAHEATAAYLLRHDAIFPQVGVKLRAPLPRDLMGLVNRDPATLAEGHNDLFSGFIAALGQGLLWQLLLIRHHASFLVSGADQRRLALCAGR
jgi:hypothetical protein